MRNPRGMAAALGINLVLAGCGGGSDDGGSGEKPVRLAEPTVPCVYDYDPASGPREVASDADLMVRGTIVDPRPGLFPVRKDGSPGRVQTDLVSIEADSVKPLGTKVQRRTMAGVKDDPVIDVEIGCAFAPPDRGGKLAALDGREVLVYLVLAGKSQLAIKTSYGPEGRPRPLFRVARLEGFLMELASGEGVRNLDLDERFPGAELEDFLPDEPRFPRQAETDHYQGEGE